MRILTLLSSTLILSSMQLQAQQTSITDFFKNTQIDGFVYAKYTGMFGADSDGQAVQARLWLNLQTGSYYGFTLGTRLKVDNAVNGPDGGTLLENSFGSPAQAISLNLMSLYGAWTPERSKTTISAGKLNINAPFADTEWDTGYGGSISNSDLDGITFNLQAYGAWGLDNWNAIHEIPSPDAEGNDTSSDRGLFIAGVNGEDLSGFGFDFWVGHAIDTIDFITFADLNYSIAGVTLQTQVATTQVNTSTQAFGVSADPIQNPIAKLRGLYNFQLNYENSGFGITAGYTGSFGDGYGTLLNYCGGFNMGGNIWWDVGSGNGYALNGVGGFKQNGKSTTIQVAYATLAYKHPKLSVDLSYAYVAGNNNYRLMQKGFNRNPNGVSLGGSRNVTLHEVSMNFAYNFTDKLSLSLLSGSTFGDLKINKTEVKLNYAF